MIQCRYLLECFLGFVAQNKIDIMKVLKFGGTSVGSAKNISKVIDIVANLWKQDKKIIVVLSAVGGMTNRLIEMSELAAKGDDTYHTLLSNFEQKHIDIVRELIPAKKQSSVFANLKRKINDLQDQLNGVFLVKELSKKSLDFILSHGERLSAYIVSEAAIEKGVKSTYIDSRKIFKTNSEFGAAKIDFEVTNKNIISEFDGSDGVHWVTGFIASDDSNVTTTLGRGGSDYSAAVLAAALDSEDVEIWTDVDGVMTADPRKVKNAFSLPAISYNEAMEMSHFGAKVIYPPTLQPVFTKKIPIVIRNTFNPEFLGTFISSVSGEPNRMRVKGISSISDVSLVTLQGSGMIGVSGFSARLFGCLANQGVNLILITQASSEHSISFAVSPGEGVVAKALIEEEFFYEIKAKKIEQVNVRKNLSVVAIIGENMTNTPGISGRMFSALGINGVNIIAIAQGSSELNISTVIDKKDLSKALNTLHDAYFLSGSRTLNVFMVGPGLIGSELLTQIKDQHDYLVKHREVNIKVVAIANSRKLLIDENGIDLGTWKEQLAETENEMSFQKFVDTINELNLPNSVFVDNTSNKEIAGYYEAILDSSVSIVTPNKVANSGTYQEYLKLKETAQKKGVSFLYETNVGAGLPIINTLQNLIHSGDEILKIEGVLSGSLSYIFNTYDGSNSFKDVVLKAKELGFTEPDPRDDLNGMDVARKILILARESGLKLEPKDVNVINPLPQNCIEAKSVDDFFVELEKSDSIFKKILVEAQAKKEKLCFIATLEEGKVNVSLKGVGENHPFQSLAGSDNMISFTTMRYKSNPLVIKGPGAGAEVTAAGVFADIITISNNLS